MDKISFVIPCYRSEKTIAIVVDDIKQTMATRPEYLYEIILVNDSSPDNVYDSIKRLAQDDSRIKGIDLAKNFGQHSALMTGYRFVTGDIVVCLDDDGQTPANQMFLLIDKLNEGFDVGNIGEMLDDNVYRYCQKQCNADSQYTCRKSDY